MRTYTTYRYVIILISSFTLFVCLSIYLSITCPVISFLAHKLLNKIKEGRVVIPLSQLSVLKAIRKKISPLFATPSDAFIPPALKLDPMMACTNPPPVIQTIPLSAAAVVRVEELITELFIRIGTNIDSMIIVNKLPSSIMIDKSYLLYIRSTNDLMINMPSLHSSINLSIYLSSGSPHPLTRVYVLDSLEKAIELVTAVCTEGIALLKTSLKVPYRTGRTIIHLYSQ